MKTGSMRHAVVLFSALALCAVMPGCGMAAKLGIGGKGGDGAKGGKADGKAGSKQGKKGLASLRVVAVEKAAKRHLVREGTYRGELRAARVVEVSPDVQGRIKKLHADMGSVVAKGDLLFELDPLEMNQMVIQGKAAVSMSEASIKQAEVALQKAQADLDRKKPLADKGLVTKADMDNLETAVLSATSALDVAKAGKAQAKASLKNLIVNKKNMKVRAPFDGMVARRYLDEGAMASPATPVFQLHEAGRLFMRVAVPESDVPFVRKDMTGVMILDALPGRTIGFTVDLISPIVEPATRTCPVDLLVLQAAGGDGAGNGAGAADVKPGMAGAATLVLDEVDGALSIPREAVIERDGRKVVFVVDAAGKASQVQVSVLGEYGAWLRVEGVAEGDDVVVKGQIDLEDGVEVTISRVADVPAGAASARKGGP